MPVVWTPEGSFAMLLFTVIALVAAWLFYDASYRREKVSRKVYRSVGTFVAVMVIFNILSLFFTSIGSITSSSRIFSPAEQAAGMGLKSDVAYPIVMGRTIDGSVGTGQFRLRYGSVDISPGSSISLQYQVSPDMSCILEIPQRDIDFQQVGDTSPTLKLSIEGNTSRGTKSVPYSGKNVGSGVVLDALHLSYYNLYSYDNAVTFQGCRALSSVLEGSVTRATLTISPEDYQKILKG
ncbi:MAG: hypothetical protein ABIP74_04405 [Candidatus Saccharimonas sp.]